MIHEMRPSAVRRSGTSGDTCRVFPRQINTHARKIQTAAVQMLLYVNRDRAFDTENHMLKEN
jgi:hypothetical protein